MDAASKAEKLAAARKKLREFESRVGNASPSQQSPSPSAEYLNGQKTSTCNTPVSSMEDSARLYEQKLEECEGLKKQLADLHGLYSQLHRAYNEQCVNVNGDGGAGRDAQQQQIVHLQSALSVLVEEKTGVQYRLREEMENRAKLEEEMRNMKKSRVVNGDEARLRDRLESSEKMVQCGMEELQEARKENALLHSNIRTLQQDKIEAQARLKATYREKEQVEEELKERRKELGMKEMQIRQYAHALGALPAHTTHHDDTTKEEEMRKAMEEVVETLKREMREKEQAHAQYVGSIVEKCTQQAQQIVDLENELSVCEEKLEQSMDEVQTATAYIQKLQHASALLETGENEVGNTGGGAEGGHGVSEEEVQRRVQQAVDALAREADERRRADATAYSATIHAKEEEVEEKEAQLSEMAIRLELAERRLKEGEEATRSVQALMSELQNEKATVSRALSQNRELKEQVVELEDRLIALTEEKMRVEMEKQSLEFAVKSGNAGPSTPSSPPPPQHTGEEEEEDRESVSGQSGHSQREEQLQHQLHSATVELQQVRDQLRESQSQNDSMNQIMQQNGEDENQNSIVVELGQAVTRVRALTEENEELRRELERMRGDEHTREEEEQRPLTNGEADDEERMRRREMEWEEKLVVVQEERDQLRQTVQSLLNRLRMKEEEEGEGRRGRTDGLTNGETSQGEQEMRLQEKLALVVKERDRLEHIRVQLEQENETIADHVVLYQHYRKVMREKLRAKDEEVQRAESERQRVAAFCLQLQHALQSLLLQQPGQRGDENGSGVEETTSQEKEGGAVQRIYELMQDMQTLPSLHREGHFPKCTQCIGETLML